MRVSESCAECLFNQQKNLTDDKDYLAEIKAIIDGRDEDDTAPYLVYRINRAYEARFGKKASYKDVKRKYNDLVMSMEDDLRKKIESSEDPLFKALVFARIGNYIDFGAMNNVDENTFLALFDDPKMRSEDEADIKSLFAQCKTAKKFLLVADNCGEIVLDKLFLEQLVKKYPQLEVSVMVRGADVLNDVTLEDAEYVGLSKKYRIIPNGNSAAGTIYHMLSDEARKAIDSAEIILAKGLGNYESMCKQGRHIFFSFLCKCELFTSRFNVPRLTGVFVEDVKGTEQVT
ncbi:MAG: ARMT1-like domain-containing protein [Butyrivibrio hungatei]|nr:ARMT1-like domain-containing protein [Butyrivibrio hungatei]